jgi:hypothetical protein
MLVRMKIGSHGLLLSALATFSALQLQAQSPQSFVPVTPCRVVDTRGTTPGAIAGGFIPGNSTRDFAIPSVTNCPSGAIPNNASAYSMNVTVVPKGNQMKWITLWPTGQSQPTASTLNSYTGLILANEAIVAGGNNGSVTAYVTDDTDVILDLNGYFLPVGSQSGTGIALGPNAHAGAFDVSIGNQAGGTNETSGSANMAIGAGVLTANNTGSLNVGIGNGALGVNTSGNYNTAIGDHSLAANTTGTSNVAIGVSALKNETTGQNNIAVGFNAGQNVNAGSNNIDIGNTAPGDESGVIRLGDPAVQNGGTYIAGISGVTVTGGIGVVIDSSGHLGTTTSSARFKEDIHDMGDASDSLMLLRPVTFRYKQPAADGSKPLQYGLIAEEVEKTYPELVVHDKDGKVMSVQYQQLPAMLLNEVQKQHAVIDQQAKEIQALEDRLGALESALASQTRSDGNLKQ